MGGLLQVANLPIIFLGDKCCACLRLQQEYRKRGGGGAGEGRKEPLGCCWGWIVCLTSLELAGWLAVTHTI